MADKQTIKQNINFLEKPLWFPAERNKQIVYEMTDELGYTYESSMGVPSKVDMLILYYCLLESQKKGFTTEIDVSFYQVLKGCGIKANNEKKSRMIESLSRWKRVTITFHGNFYDGKKYHTVIFGILETAKVSQDKKRVNIRFNKDWLATIKDSNFFKFISFSDMKHLRSPVAIRLYEILGKSFYKREKWTISAQKLATKIPLSEQYYSLIERKIRSSVNIINEKTDLNLIFKSEKKSKNDGLFTFQKVRKSMLEHMRNGQNGQSRGDKSEPPEQKDYDAEIEKLLQRLSGGERENIENEFMKHIGGNPYLLKKYKQGGTDSSTIKRTYYSYLKKRVENEENDD
ncbi:MAG: replication initiation protein [Bacteroidota bacterium]